MVRREGSSCGHTRHRIYRSEGFRHHIEGRLIQALPHIHGKISYPQDFLSHIQGISLLMPSNERREKPVWMVNSGKLFFSFKYKRDAALSQIWVLTFPAEPQLFGAQYTCYTLIKYSFKTRSSLQTNCLNILPFYFSTSIVANMQRPL